MARSGTQFYQEMAFDDVQYAIDVVKEYKAEYNKRRQGVRLSIFATIYMVVGFPIVASILMGILGSNAFGVAIVLGVGISIAAYIKGGGLGTAIGWAFKLGQFGWLILPFPFDLVTGFLFMGVSLVCFIYLPIIFVYMNYRQAKKDYESAKKHLSYYKQTVNTNQPQRVTNQLQTQYEERNYANSSQNRNQTASARTTATSNRGNSINGTSARSSTAQTSSGRTYRVITLPDGSRVYR